MNKSQTNQNKYSLGILGLAAVMAVISGCGRPHDGKDGANGTNGVNGLAGAPGAQGAAGANGTVPFYMVQLCPGTPVYPSVFIEYAFCVDGKLYGTYSANGGFTTWILPGSWQSNAIGSRCNFTVGANCAVSY